MTPLAQYEAARQRQREHWLKTGAMGCDECAAEVRIAALRIVIVALVWLVAVSVLVVMLWLFCLLVIAGFDALTPTPAPTFTDIQLPTI